MIEKSSYGTPGFFVGKKLFARLKEDGETLVVRTIDRDSWMKAKPDIYFITDHYRNYPAYMLIRLRKVSQKELKAMLLAAWQSQATKRLLKEYEEQKNIK